MIITAIDPGVATGFVTCTGNRYNLKTIVDDLNAVYNYLDLKSPELVVFENFKHRPKMNKAELYSAEVIGVIKLWAQRNRIPTENYLPAHTKAFWNREKLLKLELWRMGDEHRHEMDAMRALLTYRMATDDEFEKEVVYRLGGRIDLPYKEVEVEAREGAR